MKTKLLALAVLVAGTVFAADFSIGVRIGPPPAPRYVRIERPRAPGPDFIWVEGYWYPVNNRYRWHDGYWTRAPYQGAVWVGPRHDGEQFFDGHWGGPRGDFAHDHHWDRDHDRDYGRRDRDDRR